MARQEIPTGSPADWISLGPASRFLGVDPDTLRRWADDGRVRAYATPGGHRRFSQSDLERVSVSRQPRRRRLSALGATSDRVTRAYARSYRSDGAPAPVDQLESQARSEFRTEGRRLVAVLLAYLDATRPADRERWEAEAIAITDTTARRLAQGGASTADAVAAYVRARRPFLVEIASIGRRRALDGSQLAALFEAAIGLLDRLLLHLVATHDQVRSTQSHAVKVT